MSYFLQDTSIPDFDNVSEFVMPEARQDKSIRDFDAVAEFVSPEAYYASNKTSRLTNTAEGQGKVLLPTVHDVGNFDNANDWVGLAAKPKFKRQQGFIGPESCRECHAEFYDGFVETAHYRTSSFPSPETVCGLSKSGISVSTRVKDLHYEIASNGDDIFQLLKLNHQGTTYEHKQKVDIVTGSGNLGQTYLYLENDRLYELPVSWLSSHGWCNSPGYTDGFADFARPVNTLCMSCHATRVDFEVRHVNLIDPKSMILGVTCERCHGPGKEHVEFHRANPKVTESKFIVHPNHLSRERMNDVCAQCHSGDSGFKKSPFNFRPGDRLKDIKNPSKNEQVGGGSVHAANQLTRLQKSQCYLNSETMNCATCHNPHQNENGNLALFSKRCIECHAIQDCGQFSVSGERIEENCIDCHMPKKPDETMEFKTSGASIFQEIRDHYIRVEPEATRMVLESWNPSE